MCSYSLANQQEITVKCCYQNRNRQCVQIKDDKKRLQNALPPKDSHIAVPGPSQQQHQRFFLRKRTSISWKKNNKGNVTMEFCRNRKEWILLSPKLLSPNSSRLPRQQELQLRVIPVRKWVRLLRVPGELRVPLFAV